LEWTGHQALPEFVQDDEIEAQQAFSHPALFRVFSCSRALTKSTVEKKRIFFR